ncbi:MAG: hypothetical protein U0491_03815 [Candidatus Saccharimonadales bacterium]
MRNHPENDGSYTPSTKTEYEVIERAELIVRRSQKTHTILRVVGFALAESAKCDRNYIQPTKN